MARGKFIVLVVAVSMLAGALGSWLASELLHHGVHRRGQPAHSGDLHQWLHENLEVTPEQEKALKPVEDKFFLKRAKLDKDLKEASSALAHAIKEHEQGSPELAASMARVNELKAQIQELTLQHFFEMKEFLEPEQVEKLLDSLHNSIEHEHEHPHR